MRIDAREDQTAARVVGQAGARVGGAPTRSIVRLEVTDRLREWAPQWDALVAQGDPPTPLWRSWALEARDSSFLRYLLVRRGETLLGGLVVDLRTSTGLRTPVVRFPQECATSLDLLSTPGHEEVVAALVAEWFASHRNLVVDLFDLRPASRLPHVVQGNVTITAIGDAPYVQLPGDFGSYLAGRSRNFRSGLKRDRRRLEEAGYRHRVLAPDENGVGLTALYRLHRMRHGDDSDFLPWFDTFARIAYAGAAAGEFRFDVLARDDEIIAIEAMFQVGPYINDFQGGRDVARDAARGAGTVLVAAIIEDACTRDVAELDLHYGFVSWKRRFTDTVRPVVRLHSTRGWAPVWIPRAKRLAAGLRSATPGRSGTAHKAAGDA